MVGLLLFMTLDMCICFEMPEWSWYVSFMFLLGFGITARCLGWDSSSFLPALRGVVEFFFYASLPPTFLELLFFFFIYYLLLLLQLFGFFSTSFYLVVNMFSPSCRYPWVCVGEGGQLIEWCGC